jgi:hypothetical protein
MLYFPGVVAFILRRWGLTGDAVTTGCWSRIHRA